MKKIIILTAMSLLAIIALRLSLAAQESSEDSQSRTLKSIMQEMFSDTQLITEGIFYEDFAQIEQAAKRIADHPAPDLKTKNKLVSYMGKNMPKFKGFDIAVHNTANNISRAAQQKNMPDTISEYHKMIDGCQSCHSSYKQAVSKILNEQ